MVATAFAAVLCWGTLRATALQRRAAFHAQEKQSCLQQAQAAEKDYQSLKQRLNEGSCEPRGLMLEIAEDFEAAPELRERAVYHAELEARYRRTARYPWMLAPSQKPFIPDDRIRSFEWLRDKAEAYRSLESARREYAKYILGQGKQSEQQLRIAASHATMAAEYDRRARLVGGLDGGHR
jgi:hypothetical protein